MEHCYAVTAEVSIHLLGLVKKTEWITAKSAEDAQHKMRHHVQVARIIKTEKLPETD